MRREFAKTHSALIEVGGVFSEAGAIDLEVPRDRNGTHNAQLRLARRLCDCRWNRWAWEVVGFE
jgi:hypothetical protein